MLKIKTWNLNIFKNVDFNLGFENSSIELLETIITEINKSTYKYFIQEFCSLVWKDKMEWVTNYYKSQNLSQKYVQEMMEQTFLEQLFKEINNRPYLNQKHSFAKWTTQDIMKSGDNFKENTINITKEENDIAEINSMDCNSAQSSTSEYAPFI